MLGRKRLQVFVSSTYTDLHAERQAAVEAILTAGHIPAGMELFAAGDQSQMAVIRRWIDESDVFLLILGGRYGSVEPASQKSYTHLEYEYALECGKPVFAVVIADECLDEKIRTNGKSVIKTDNPHKLRDFRNIVLQRLVKFWSDPRDIKLAIHETMSEFARRNELIGWVPGDQTVNTAALAEEIARLTRENAQLREQLAHASSTSPVYNGLSFEQMYRLLNAELIELDALTDKGGKWIGDKVRGWMVGVARAFGDTSPSALHVFWYFRDTFQDLKARYYLPGEGPLAQAIKALETAGLITIRRAGPNGFQYGMTESGRNFLLRLMLEGGQEAKQQVHRMP